MADEQVVEDGESTEELEAALAEQERVELEGLEDEPVEKDDPVKETAPTPPTPEEVSELERKQQGTYEAFKAERAKRQAIEAKFTSVSEALREIRQEREAKAVAEPTPAKPAKKRVQVEVDEETGDAYVEGEYLTREEVEELIKKSGVPEKVQQIEGHLTQQQMMEESERAFQETVNSVIETDSERFSPAIKDLDKTLEWVDKELCDILDDEGIPHGVLSGKAIDILEGNDMFMAEFDKKFPGVDVALVARAYDSKSDLRRALKHYTGLKGDESIKPGLKAADNLKRIASKGRPANLGGAPNRSVDTGVADLDDYQNLSQEDIDSMSDAELNKLERAMAKAQDG